MTIPSCLPRAAAHLRKTLWTKVKYHQLFALLSYNGQCMGRKIHELTQRVEVDHVKGRHRLNPTLISLSSTSARKGERQPRDTARRPQQQAHRAHGERERTPRTKAIVTPPETHFELAKICIKHRTPILIEKPFTQSYKESRLLSEELNKHKLICMVGYQHLFSKKHQLLKKQYDMFSPSVN